MGMSYFIELKTGGQKLEKWGFLGLGSNAVLNAKCFTNDYGKC